jgi:hypothetical protein
MKFFFIILFGALAVSEIFHYIFNGIVQYGAKQERYVYSLFNNNVPRIELNPQEFYLGKVRIVFVGPSVVGEYKVEGWGRINRWSPLHRIVSNIHNELTKNWFNR